MAASPRRKHTKQDIEKQRLTYRVDYKTVELPNHVSRIKDILCDFRDLLPIREKTNFEGDVKVFSKLRSVAVSGQNDGLASRIDGKTTSMKFLKPPKSAYYQPGDDFPTIGDPRDIRYAREKAKACSVATEARKLSEDKREDEIEWLPLLCREIFSRQDSGQMGTPEDWRKSDFNDYTINQNMMFSEAISFPEFRRKHDKDNGVLGDRERSLFSWPKPDFTYSFQILDAGQHISGLHQSGIGQNFTLSVLSQLNKHGLIPSPVAGLQSLPRTKEEENANRYTCFPWAVVESKRQGEKTEVCYSQATKAAFLASRIYGVLMPAKWRLFWHEIPPVVVFTNVGPQVTLWLAYPPVGSDPAFQFIMVPIWDTSILLTWGVVALRRVIRNMLNWAKSELKPSISHFIDLWHAKYILLPERRTQPHGAKFTMKRTFTEEMMSKYSIFTSGPSDRVRTKQRSHKVSARMIRKGVAMASFSNESEDQDDESESENEESESKSDDENDDSQDEDDGSEDEGDDSEDEDDDSEDEGDDSEDEDDDSDDQSNQSEDEDGNSEDQGTESGYQNNVFRALSGRQLTQLTSIRQLIEKLQLEDLGEIIIESFRYCLEQGHEDRYDKKTAIRLLQSLNEVVGATKPRPGPIHLRLLILEERDWWLIEVSKKELSQKIGGLHEMRHLVRKALKMWDGALGLNIMKPYLRLLKQADWKNLQSQALKMSCVGRR